MEKKKFVITQNNVDKYTKDIGEWIKNKVETANCNGVVLGMSGGVDCSVVARLCMIAGVNTHLVMMMYGKDMIDSKHYKDAIELINKFKFSYHEIDIKKAVDSIKIKDNSNYLGNNLKNIELARMNIRPRIRMTYLYQYAQLNNLLVAGTGNLSERTLGYFTKWGDGANDFNPVGMITKKEIYILAKYLKIPENIIKKAPSADLKEGQTDEKDLGLNYEQIDEYILNCTSGNKDIDKIIKNKNKIAKHKLDLIPIFNH